MKKLLLTCVTAIANRSVSLLKRKRVSFSRDEWRHVRLGFSQFGEETYLHDKLFGVDTERRVYLDAGAFDPILFSNTLFLRASGWKGIHIEMDPQRAAGLQRALPDHVTVCAPLSSRPGTVCTRFKYGVGETDKIIAKPMVDISTEERLSLVGHEPDLVEELRAITLDEAIVQSNHRHEEIGFINIDCEGHDLEVLKGLDLGKCQPAVIAIECHNMEELNSVGEYLKPYGYEFDAWFRPTAFF